GIDIGHVDVVCHIGSPRTLNILLQRVGRSGHWLGALPKGIFYPLTRDDLMQCAAGIRTVRDGQLDRLTIPEKPLDILAQQMVATVASVASSSDATANQKRSRSEERRVGKSEDRNVTGVQTCALPICSERYLKGSSIR